ncbi:SRPBCC domain-containing protein [Sphingomonas bacterium]|uniref:SRPBCC domain-containing protein n=1 Tax=Sphingomonas bacterium TaxID=1895847 RepID=UPI0015755854|nr:SRPBCC domain-containing protein [Sphingomonas bacterium]
MMHQLVTTFSVPQSPEQVWQVLTDLPSYQSWNSFMIAAAGELVVGNKLEITLSPSPDRKTTFKPTLLVVDKSRELRWRGRLIVKGLFDGEHFWTLAAHGQGGTTITHGETFTGLLVRVVKPETFKPGFERMNRDMAAELTRRFDGG